MYTIPNIEHISNKQIIDYLKQIEINSCVKTVFTKDDVYGLIIVLLAERNSLKLQLEKLT